MGDLKLQGAPPMLQLPNPCPTLIGIETMVVDFVAVAIPLAQTQTSRGRIVSHLREITKEATLRVLETPLTLVQVIGSRGNPIAY